MNEYHVDKFAWQRAIFELPLPAVTKLTAIAMSVYANKDGTRCHPGLGRLARDVGISTRRVADHVRTLRDLGVVELVSQGGGRGRRLADCYRLTWSDETANLVDELEIRRTSRRPEYACDTADGTSGESSETTDARGNTPDVGDETTDVGAVTPDAASSPHQSVNTSHLSPGVLSPFSDSRVATASSPDDEDAIDRWPLAALDARSA